MTDRPAIQTDEIEINPEMIQAGVQHLWEAGRMGYPADGPDQILVGDILRACLEQGGYATKIAEPARKAQQS